MAFEERSIRYTASFLETSARMLQVQGISAKCHLHTPASRYVPEMFLQGHSMKSLNIRDSLPQSGLTNTVRLQMVPLAGVDPHPYTMMGRCNTWSTYCVQLALSNLNHNIDLPQGVTPGPEGASTLLIFS